MKRLLWFVPLLAASPALLATALAQPQMADSREPLLAGLPLSAQARTSLSIEHAALERGWRTKARQGFPGDRWSQGDDLANSEAQWAREAAMRTGRRIEEILELAAEELRAARAVAPDRGVVPACMPRPFYD